MALRVRPARHWQPPDAPARILAQAARPLIRRDLRKALKHLRRLVPSNEKMEAAIRAGAPREIKNMIAWDFFDETLKVPLGHIAEVRLTAGEAGTRALNAKLRRRRRLKIETPSRGAGGLRNPAGGFVRKTIDSTVVSLMELFDVGKDIGDRFNFDRFDRRTTDRIRDAQDRLIRQLTNDARDTVDAVVMAGVQTGLSPADIVGDIREMIGLTSTQAQAVMNYRRMLETLDGGALGRQLRNRGYDDAIREAIEAGTPLDEALVDLATQDYEDRYLDYRAATIAQTESVRASNAGLRDAYQQAVERGALPSDAVRRHWQVALDEKTCPICLSIPDMNEEGVPVDGSFQSDEGPIDDPPVHPNCRCSVEYVTDLDKIPEDDE